MKEGLEVTLVYCDYTDLWWLRRLLRRGFRHCFAVWRDPTTQQWLMLDSLANGLVVELLDLPLSCDFPKWLARQPATTTQSIRIQAWPQRAWFLTPMTCVTTLKRLCGLSGWRAAFVVTPYQLFNYVQLLNKRRAPYGTTQKSQSASAGTDYSICANADATAARGNTASAHARGAAKD